MTPRSTSETTGISGSGISSSAGPDLGLGHHCAPAGAERRTIVISSHSSASSSVCVPRSTALDLVQPDARASSARCSGVRTPSAYGHSSATRLLEARLVAQPLVPHLGVHAVVRLLAVDLRREARDLRIVVVHQRRDAGSRPPPRRASAARSCAPSRAGAARRAARSGTPRAGGRTRARPRRPPAAGRRRARGRSRSARSTRTRRPPRASARSPSTRSRASRGQLVVSQSQQIARSRASFRRALIE